MNPTNYSNLFLSAHRPKNIVQYFSKKFFFFRQEAKETLNIYSYCKFARVNIVNHHLLLAYSLKLEAIVHTTKNGKTVNCLLIFFFRLFLQFCSHHVLLIVSISCFIVSASSTFCMCFVFLSLF